MRILIVHNHYGKYAVGGEANAMNAEAELLQAHGHDVKKLEVTNAQVYEDGGILDKIHAFHQTTWSSFGYRIVSRTIAEFRPDVMHVHNYWVLLSPSIFAAAKDHGTATVLTLHNYRLICPGVLFFRNNKPCELCLNGLAWRVIFHRCHTGKSLLKSILAFRLYNSTRKMGFLSPWVDAYIALTNFSREKFIRGGLPGEKVYVKPNFMKDPLPDIKPGSTTSVPVFAGRLSAEKGIMPLVRAWQGIDSPLYVIGDGPQMEEARHAAPSTVRFLNQKSHEETLEIIRNCSFLIFPSECYEGFPLTLLEAMAMSKCVVASNHGSMGEIVKDGKTGLLFKPGNIDHLRGIARQLINDPQRCAKMGKAGRATYLKNYAPDKNYDILMRVYNRILEKG